MVRTLVLFLCVTAATSAATSSPPHHLFQQASSLVDDDAWWQRHGIKAGKMSDESDSRVGTLGGILKAFALAARARGARMGGADNTGQVRFIRVPDATADGPGPFPALGVLMVSEWEKSVFWYGGLVGYLPYIFAMIPNYPGR